MPELSHLNHAERVFLAGCIRTTVLVDGSMQEAELKDIDSICRKLDFKDYEACLGEYEQNVPDRDAFLKEAAKIRNPEAQELILNTVYELTIQNGAPEVAEEALFMALSKVWEKG
jgi:hypothetical protein